MKKATTGPLRYASYQRCSTDDQKQGDFSTIDNQQEVNLAYINEKGGVQVAVYKDEGRSGANLERPGWNQMLKDAQNGLFDVVVVTYMSRLGRGESFTIAEYLLNQAKVEVEMVMEKFTKDMSGYIKKSMSLVLDRLIVERAREQTTLKIDGAFSRGHFCGGTVPYGYRSENISGIVSEDPDYKVSKHLVLNPETAPLVRRAFELFHETHCATDVCKYLQSVTGEHWRYDRVKYLLTNETYRGVRRVGSRVNYTSHEPIVSEALWDFVQDALKNKVRSSKRNPVDTSAYYLRSLVSCPACGYRMTPGDHHGSTAPVRYYECVGAHKRKTVGCPVRRVNARSLHEAVVSEIQRAADHPTRMTELVREAVKTVPVCDDLKNELAAVNRTIREKDRGIKNCLNVVEKGQGGAALMRRLEQLQEEKDGLRARCQAIEQKVEQTRLRRPNVDEVIALWSRFGKLWQAATEKEKSELLPLLVEKVEMIDKEHGVAWLIFAAPVPELRAEKDNPTSLNVGLTSVLGARPEVIANHFPFLTLDSPLLSPDGMRGLPQAPASSC